MVLITGGQFTGKIGIILNLPLLNGKQAVQIKGKQLITYLSINQYELIPNWEGHPVG